MKGIEGMVNIYIDKNKREIVVKDKKDKIIKKYSNLSTKNSDGIRRSVKLFMYSLNKIFLINRYNDEEYMFFINDEELISIIKLENDLFRTSINKEWHNIYDKKTVSEIGTFLSFLKRIKNKNAIYWERSELFNLKDEKENLYLEQSECDKNVQDILHEIQVLSEEDITDTNCMAFVYKLREVRKLRNSIKTKIKALEVKERELTYEK